MEPTFLQSLTAIMFEQARNDELLLASIAHRWVSYMGQARRDDAQRLLARDCGFFGVDVQPHSTLYLPMRTLRTLPHLIVRKLFAAKNEVSLHAELLEPGDDGAAYRIYFRFYFAKISKVHLSRLLPGTTFCLDRPQFELPVRDVVSLQDS